MASGIDMKVEFPELKELQRGFRELRPSLSRKYMGAAIRRSLKPAVSALRGNVVRGPTGNLRRAISSKVKSYKSGAAVGLVGFVAAGSQKSKSAAGGSVKIGKDRAFHAGFLEFGTKDRAIKTSSIRGGASIASSFRRLGAFKILPVRGAVLSDATPVRTKPGYPRAFFKKAAKGQILRLGEMPIGGSKGKPPVKSAYRESLGQTRSQLVIEMTRALQNAIKETLNPRRP